MGHTFGAKAKAAIVAGSVALAVMPATAFASPRMQVGQFGQQPGQMNMAQAADGQFGGEGMGQMDGQQPVEGERTPAMPDGQQPGDGQQPPAMPDGQQPVEGEQPPALPDGQQPGDGQQPPAGPMGQAREFIQKFINLLGIEVDQAALEEFFNGFGAQQPGTQQTGAQQGEGTMGEARI